jgi:maleylacetate reductase
MSSRGFHLSGADLDRASETLADPYWTPRTLEAGPLRAPIQRAWEGTEPQP